MGGLLGGFVAGAGKGASSAVDDLITADLQARRDARLEQYGISKEARQAAAQEKRDAAEHKNRMKEAEYGQDLKDRTIAAGDGQQVYQRDKDGSYKKVIENEKEFKPGDGQGSRRDMNNDAWARASKAFGTMDNGMLKLDGPDKEKAAWTADQTIKIMDSDGVDINAAFLKALSYAETRGIMTKDEALAAAHKADLAQYAKDNPLKGLVGIGEPSKEDSSEKGADVYKKALGQSTGMIDRPKTPPASAATGGVGGPAQQNETPPVDGAMLAPDGNWYVKKNGKYFKVEQ